MHDLNRTTRVYPRTSLQAFHTFDTIYGPYRDKNTPRAWVIAEHVLLLVCTYGLGFVTCYLMLT